MERSYYRKYYALEREHWWFLVRAAIIKKVVRKYIGATGEIAILNTGVATGGSTELLQEFGAVTSVETDKECCRFLKDELNMQVTEASVTQLPFNGEVFQLVCAFDVIEHIEDDVSAIKEMGRVCDNEGWLLLTVPASPWLWSTHDEVNHHYRRYTQASVKKLLLENGYRVHYMSGFNFLLFIPIAAWRLISELKPVNKRKKRSDFEIPFLYKSSFFNKLLKAVFGLEKRMLPFLKVPFGISIIVLARKK